MPFVDSAGTRIYFDDRGVGEPVLVCLPGWCVDHTIYGPVAERLGGANRVLVPDWRGHGDSGPLTAISVTRTWWLTFSPWSRRPARAPSF